MKKLLITGLLGLSFLATSAMANYNKGYKYYNKYVKRKTGIKAPVFVEKILKAEMPDDVAKKVKNWSELEKSLKEFLVKEKGWTPEEVDKLFKTGAWHKLEKHKKDLIDFFKGIKEGKIPAGCG